MIKIMPNNLKRGFEQYQEEYEQKALEVLRSGWYILGNEVKEFDKNRSRTVHGDSHHTCNIGISLYKDFISRTDS